MSPKLETGSSALTEEPIHTRENPLSTLVLPERPPLDELAPDLGHGSESARFYTSVQRHSAFHETIWYFTEVDLPTIQDLPRDLTTSDLLRTFPMSTRDQQPGEDSALTLTGSPQALSINQSLFMLRQFVSLTSAWPSNSQQSLAASLTYDPTNNRFRLEYFQNSQQSSLAGSSSSRFGMFAEQSSTGTSVGVILPLGGQPESAGRLGIFRQQLTSFLDFYRETYSELSPDEQQQLRTNTLAILDSCVSDLATLASQTQSDQQKEFASALAERMREIRNEIANVR